MGKKEVAPAAGSANYKKTSRRKGGGERKILNLTFFTIDRAVR